jgi:hypothetical protein
MEEALRRGGGFPLTNPSLFKAMESLIREYLMTCGDDMLLVEPTFSFVVSGLSEAIDRGEEDCLVRYFLCTSRHICAHLALILITFHRKNAWMFSMV